MKYLLIDFGASYIKMAVYDKTNETTSSRGEISSPFQKSCTITKHQLWTILLDIIVKNKDVDAIVICTILGGGWKNDVYYSWKSSDSSEKKYCLISGLFHEKSTFHVHEHHGGDTNNGIFPLGDIEGKTIYSSLGDTKCVIESLDINSTECFINMGTGSQVIFLQNDSISITPHFPCGRSLLVFNELFSCLGVDMFSHIKKLSVDDIINSNLNVDLNNFEQARGYQSGGKITGIQEGRFDSKNFFGSLVREMVTQYEKSILASSKSKIRLVGGIPKKIPVLVDVFSHYYKDKNVAVENNIAENTHIGMIKIINRWL